jgi:DNA mismatch repair protein MutL
LPDIIHLLADNIANQIAAGEVIQRPSSAVKELMENAIDAHATDIRLIINDAGKALVQVIDNGSGMSAADARKCFERHATSKITGIDDLFRIKTMGFRGEALASIAAVAEVVLKTKREADEWGTCIEIDNSVPRKEEPVAMPAGTSIAMKNLFFNVPARRNFLKSNASEMRHIIEEFMRIALAFPEIFFSLTANGQELFHLEKGSLKQRLVQVLGSSYNARLVSVQENTDYLNIYGFAGKPDTAKKTRGDQYFFVNNRFIKSPYLNHAVMSAYQELIPADSFPAYTLFIDIDPAQLDVNVHPTKQEIKFEDEKIVYAFVQAAVKHALAQFSVTPTLDFDLDASIQQLDAVSKPFTARERSTAADSSLYQTFSRQNQAHKIEKSELRDWKEFYTPIDASRLAETPDDGGNPASGGTVREPWQSLSQTAMVSAVPELSLPESDSQYLQILQTYVLVSHPGGLLLIHQQAAHERILYERFTHALKGKALPSQSCLFPSVLPLAPADSVLLDSLLGDLQQLGYLIEPFGKDSFAIQGTPADLEAGSEKRVIEQLLEQFKHSSGSLQVTPREKLMRGLARQQAIKAGAMLAGEEMRHLAASLMACQQPNVSPFGQPVYAVLDHDSLNKLFTR